MSEHEASEQLSEAQLDDAIERLVSAAKVSARARNHDVRPVVNSISGLAYRKGLSTDAMTTIIDLVRLPSHLDQTSITTLIKALYPSQRLSSSLLCKVVGSLGQGGLKPSPATQHQLLRWIILVYEILEDHSFLSQLYNALFNLLDTLSLRPYLCHLLAMITRRKHVKPHRIQTLLELSRTSVNEPALLGLLRVYKEYYPDVILGQPNGRVARFEHPDPEWRDRLRAIQERSLNKLDASSQSSAFKVSRTSFKRQRTSLVPEVHTHHVTEVSVSIEQIDGVDDFVENLEKIEFPSQMISAFSDRLFQKLILLKDDRSSQTRINRWLSLFLDSQLQLEEVEEEVQKGFREILQKTLQYTQYTKALPTSVISFFPRFIARWDGNENRDVIIRLLTYLPLQPFNELLDTTLGRFENAIIDNSQESFVDLLSVYTGLLQNWTSQLLSVRHSSNPNPLEALVDHSSILMLNLLAINPTIATQVGILRHLSTLAHTISHAPTHPSIRILTPTAQVVYLLTFLSPTAATLSSLTSTLATYKLAFESAMVHPAPGTIYEYPREYVNLFNGFLMDLCNLLWRSRAFNTTDINALGCLVPETILSPLRIYLESVSPPQPLPALFSLSLHPALAALSIAAFRDLEDQYITGGQSEMDIDDEVRTRHAGPVSLRSLASLGANGGIKLGWTDYRLEVLKWLGERGVDGVRELMFCTMKLLMTKSQSHAS